MSDKFICPISLAPVKEYYGITCNGSIYDYDQIMEWQKEHITDPCTNIPIFNAPAWMIILKYRKDAPWSHIEKIAANRRKDFINNAQISICGFTSPLYIRDVLMPLRDMLYNNPSQEWLKYQEQRRQQFIDGPCYAQEIDSSIIEPPRPSNTGKSFQFLNLSNITKRKVGYKFHTFEGADLSGCVFIKCDFSHSSFALANLTNTVFSQCSFPGDDVNFLDCIAKGTSFYSCTIEDTCIRWKRVTEPTLVRRALYRRNMNVDNVIIH